MPEAGDRRSPPRKFEDSTRCSERRRHRDDEYESSRGGHRSGSRENEYRRRSRSPGLRNERTRSRDRERRRDRDRERRRNSSGERDRRKVQSPDPPRSRHKPRRTADDDDQLRSDGRRSLIKRSGPLPSQNDSFALSKGEEIEKPKEKPNFGTTGLLAAASNSVTQADGSVITLKYHEPPEARKPPPRDMWKLFVFKGDDVIDTIELSTRSCWLIGRELAVVDIAAEHPSISKQHAVIQFRYTEKRNEFGDKIGRVKPYLIDLESANGTLLNDEKVPESRYLELRNKDVIQLGSSTREYVIMLAPRD